uniref:Tetratricopeptide repeat domain 21A n=1 Tax=Callorhinchus milii TaxID=7868 RepID=A0A4W3HT16_CALMI
TGLLALIVYYCQEKYFHHVLNIVHKEMQVYNNEPILCCFAGRIQEAIRDLEAVRQVQDISLCSTMALIYAHRRNRDAIQELDANLKESRKIAGERPLYYAGMFLWLMDRHEKAKEYIDRMLKISSGSKEGLILKGWIDLTSVKMTNMKRAMTYLEEGLQDSKNLLGLMGKVGWCEQNYSSALEIVSQIIVTLPEFLPALIMKMRLFLAQQNWEQTLETAQRILQKDSSNVDALQMLCLHSLCKEGNQTELIGALEKSEPENPKLYQRVAVVLSRMCSRNNTILEQTYSLVEHAVHLNPGDAEMVTELGFQLILQGKVGQAAKQYMAAMKLDESNMPALTGRIRAQILQGQIQDAEQQLEFLREVQESIGMSGELAYLQAVIAAERGQGQQLITKLLKQAADIHFLALENLPLGVEYYEKLNPEFLLDIVKKLLSFCPHQPITQGQALSLLLRQCAMILDPVVKAAPGMMEALYYMAKVRFLSGKFETAHGMLQQCLLLDPSFSDGHLLMAQIYLSQGNFKESSHSLEMGLSYNFQVREHPIYHLIKARALNKMGNVVDTITTLKIAMNLPGVRRSTAGKTKGDAFNISTNDRVSVYLELANAHHANGQQHEAAKVMQDAIHEFAGTAEEIRITIANVDLALSRDDLETAFTMLRNVHPDQPYYTEAKEKMAQIYLQKQRDKRLYIGCYKDLCDQLPSPHTSLLLGDAYISIQEPEKAIEIYEHVLKKNPHDGHLVKKIGQALVKTHHYTKAVHYYEAALKIGGQEFLCYDLAELLLRLGLYDRAQKVLRKTLEHGAINDITSLMRDVKYLMLLAKVCNKTNEMQEAMDILNKAHELQGRILKRLPLEQPDIIPIQKQLAVSICSQLAQISVDQRDFDKAIRYYKEGLTYAENDSTLMLELSRLYLTKGDNDECEQQCVALLKNVENNYDANMMMADLMFRKQEYQQAIFYYRQMLERSPDNFAVLCKLIELFRKAGKLDKAPEFLELAEKKSTRTALEPGFNYCKGLYLWHIGQPNDALKHFNKARKDSDWGHQAIYSMIQICLNPDNEIIGGNVFESLDEETRCSERRETDQLAVRTAEKLLKEYHPRTKQGQEQRLLLQNSCLVATNERSNVERALTVLTEMAATKKDHVPALLAIAQACMVLKLVSRARNQLKRITKIDWNSMDAEAFEKSWLLLSDIYIKAGKFDLAMDLLKRCLQYNQSCCKAYEYLGFVMEKEQSYMDAVNHYEMAWKYSSESNPTMGYKLAFNYLKAKMYVQAIDICHKVRILYEKA